jgi:hypothetical protein
MLAFEHSRNLGVHRAPQAGPFPEHGAIVRAFRAASSVRGLEPH